MPRFYIDIHDGIEAIDDTGQDIPHLEAAKVAALRIASEFVAKPQMLGKNGGTIVLTIRNGPDSVVSTLRLVFDIQDG